MAADLAADNERRVWADAARDLRQGLLEFADDERFDDDAGQAATEYWNDLYTSETLPLMSDSEAERFFDWFAFDHTLPSNGSRIAELYRSENGPGLPPPQRELLDQWIAAAPMGGYELVGYNRQTLQLKELLSGEIIDLYEPGGPGNAPLGAIILGRPVPVHDHLEFFSTPAYIPPDEIADLSDRLAAAREADPAAGENDFLRRHNVLLIHHALEQAKKAGRPPVARLDPRHTPEGVRHRMRHERVRIKGPAGLTENAPVTVKAHRKAI
jgi:hypothetical protein